MKKLILSIMVAAGFAATAQADNVADCEVLIQKPVELDGVKTSAYMKTYVPAIDFIASVYDDEAGHETQALGHDIKVLFCTRHNLIPTLRDFPLLATGIPMAVSPNFDASDSPIIYYFHDGEKFIHVYEGPDLSDDNAAKLTDAMDAFNLQPHNLGK